MNKPRIGLFGRRNRGKSTLLNALMGQQVAIVSPEAGTTTDPVRKSIELLGVGPVVCVDTAGLDDESMIGGQRVSASWRELAEVDLAIILFSDGTFDDIEDSIVRHCCSTDTPFILLHTLSDRHHPDAAWLDFLAKRYDTAPIVYCDGDANALQLVVNRIGTLVTYSQTNLLDGIVNEGDHLLLCCPIDSEAPAGRLILPQVQVLRAALDLHAIASLCQPKSLVDALRAFTSPPRLVVTDSQVFKEVASIVPMSVPLTSFSMLLARAKGPFLQYMEGAMAIDNLSSGDRVLILESCTHTASCEDIGRIKLPRMLSLHAGTILQFDFISGMSEIVRPITDYSLVVQCGGCVATPRQIYARLAPAISAGVPITNYGIALAHLAGILPRATQVFRQ